MTLSTTEPGQESAVARPTPFLGLMMDFPLTVHHIVRRMAGMHGSAKVITLLDPDSGECSERDFQTVVARAGRLAHALQRLGVRPGDRVASLAWNSAQHLEVYLGVMSMGAVLHTINLRLHPDQIAYTANHAEDSVVIVDSSLAGQLAEVLPKLTTVTRVIVINESDDPCTELTDALDYEDILAQESPDFEWPDVGETSAASLCYTSGTTGNPKGVLYSHRSIVLHALAMSSADAFGVRGQDRVLALVPLFHAMGWGLPFVCGLVGADVIMPGRHLRPAPLARLIETHRATWSCGVPTVWLDLLHFVDERMTAGHPVDLSSLHTILCGGTAVPESLIERYEALFGAEIIRGWGMTETFPGASVGRDQPLDTAGQKKERRKAGGRVSPLYELRLVDPTGDLLPHDGVAIGEIEVRGPAVVGEYFRDSAATAEKFHDGWLRTGDIATIDGEGWLRITDRAKDGIKSGGEWISTQDLEGELLAHPAVREAAVVGRPDERWGERPIAYVVLKAPATPDELKAFLASRVARWWIPDHFEFVEEIARTSTGKYDKKILRSWGSEQS